jgi:predicted nucleic acid-binding protein
MAVVADTSPVNYLVLIAQIDLLARLYARILIPPAVLAELKHPLAPEPVRHWACDAPTWLEVLSPKSNLILPNLDLGETEAIALAIEMHAEVWSSMSRLAARKPFVEGWRLRARSPCSTKPIGPDWSFSTMRSLY